MSRKSECYCGDVPDETFEAVKDVIISDLEYMLRKINSLEQMDAKTSECLGLTLENIWYRITNAVGAKKPKNMIRADMLSVSSERSE
jgi:hypothetical protein